MEMSTNVESISGHVEITNYTTEKAEAERKSLSNHKGIQRPKFKWMIEACSHSKRLKAQVYQ